MTRPATRTGSRTPLKARRAGLTSGQAADLLAQHGPNEIRREHSRGHLRAIAGQLVDPLALLLWAAAVLAAAQGTTALAAAIVAVVLLNAGFAFVQELQAERATESLKRYLPVQVRVRRDGRVQALNACDLVPGDLLLVGEGDRLSADARLVFGAVELDMAPLTGESLTVQRIALEDGEASETGLDAEDLVFAGSACTGGAGEAVVVATGMATEIGRIAALTQQVRQEPSPLQRQVRRAAKLIAAFAVGGGVLFLALGTLVAGLPLEDAMSFAIGLLVANVPEGLLPTITLALAIGVRRMARRNALVKRLTAVETLGSTDVICTDKTGTLTEGRMTLSAWWTPRDAPLRPLLRCAVRCNNAWIAGHPDAWTEDGDPSESALLVGAAAAGYDVVAAQVARDTLRETTLHFDARRKRMSTIDTEDDGSRWLHAKGAPLELLGRCERVRLPDGVKPLDDGLRAEIAAAFEHHAGEGLRVLGFAERQDPPAGSDAMAARDDAESGLTFLGLAAMHDPPRAGVKDAVAQCHAAGLRIIVVTGDHGATALAIARQLGVVRHTPVLVQGPEVEQMDERELAMLLDRTPEVIVARSNPETKLRIVASLQALGHTVAMTGDGVNDAPALRRADIGVAMGLSGTEVAREAATMVLTDDSFASIAAAVEEGRVVYDNLRKFITYIFAHLTPEVVPFLVYALAGGRVPLPLTALQILAIDLGTETLPALALGRERAEPDVMDRPPRPGSARLIDRHMLVRAWVWIGLVEAVLVTGAFFWVLRRGGWTPGAEVGPGSPLHESYLTATTATFAAIVACQVGAGFAARTTRASLGEIGVFSNRLLLWGIAFELVFAGAVIYLEPLQGVFGTAPLPVSDLLVFACMAPIVWAADDVRRRVWNRRAELAPRRPAV